MPDFQTQLWVSAGIQEGTPAAPTAHRMDPMNTESVDINGKPCGGLWTSTRLARGYSDWVAFCVREAPYFLADRWALQVAPAARVLRVATQVDRDALPTIAAKSGIHCNNGGRAIDWKRLSRSFDGVNIVNPNVMWRFSEDFASECTFWFRWSFTRVWLDMRGRPINRPSNAEWWHTKPKRFDNFA